MPVRRLFIGMRKCEYVVFTQRSPTDLQSDR